jgi:hypothetical protein
MAKVKLDSTQVGAALQEQINEIGLCMEGIVKAAEQVHAGVNRSVGMLDMGEIVQLSHEVLACSRRLADDNAKLAMAGAKLEAIGALMQGADSDE